MKRRDFLKYGAYGAFGLTAAALGQHVIFGRRGGDGGSFTPSTSLSPDPRVIDLGMTTADVEMIDGRPVFHWLFGQDLGTSIRPSFPGPVIFHFEDEPLLINIRNNISDGVDRRFAILGPPAGATAFPVLKQSDSVSYGAAGAFSLEPFEIPSGTYLYKDPSLDPLSRLMGLHGALIVLPAAARRPIYADAYPKPTPYTNPTPNIQLLFNDLGVGTPRDPNAHFPGQPWFPTKDANSQYDPDKNESDHEHFMHFRTEPHGPRSEIFETFLYRNRVWVHHQIDPVLNARVAEGKAPDPETVRDNFLPQYFTLNGRGGATSSHSPDVVPIGTIGEPHVIRLLNAGLASHSPHLHANHFYVLSVNNVPGGGAHQAPAGDGILAGDALAPDNLILVDTMTLGPQDRVDWLLPFMRPPDIPRVLENYMIHRPGEPTTQLLLSLTELTQEERRLMFITPQTPLSWPMHCHMEMAQTAAGGNYPQGQVTQWEIHGEFGLLFESVPIRVSPAPPRKGI